MRLSTISGLLGQHTQLLALMQNRFTAPRVDTSSLSLSSWPIGADPEPQPPHSCTLRRLHARIWARVLQLVDGIRRGGYVRVYTINLLCKNLAQPMRA